MPARQPFTRLCASLARRQSTGRADLHIHTTYSDGTYTPSQIVELARRSGLAAVAITDHDTIAGIPEAREAGTAAQVEIVPAVEITAQHAGRDFHLLAYFVRLDFKPLLAALEDLAARRAERFRLMLASLSARGILAEREAGLPLQPARVPGRRHLAEMLLRERRVTSVREAFSRYLDHAPGDESDNPGLPVRKAIALVREAGGVAAWAHPPYDCSESDVQELVGWGLQAIEAVYPSFRPRRSRRLREMAARMNLAVTGGSDCHGPEHAGRNVGARTVGAAELDALRRLSIS